MLGSKRCILIGKRLRIGKAYGEPATQEREKHFFHIRISFDSNRLFIIIAANIQIKRRYPKFSTFFSAKDSIRQHPPALSACHSRRCCPADVPKARVFVLLPLRHDSRTQQILSVDSPHKTVSQISLCNGTRRTAVHVHPRSSDLKPFILLKMPLRIAIIVDFFGYTEKRCL